MTSEQQQQYDYALRVAKKIVEWLDNESFLVTLYDSPIDYVRHDEGEYIVVFNHRNQRGVLYNALYPEAYADRIKAEVERHIKVYEITKKELEVNW